MYLCLCIIANIATIIVALNWCAHECAKIYKLFKCLLLKQFVCTDFSSGRRFYLYIYNCAAVVNIWLIEIKYSDLMYYLCMMIFWRQTTYMYVPWIGMPKEFLLKSTYLHCMYRYKASRRAYLQHLVFRGVSYGARRCGRHNWIMREIKFKFAFIIQSSCTSDALCNLIN